MTTRYESENDGNRNRPENARYAAFTDELGAVVVYDTKNNAGWLKSDVAVAVDEMD